MSKLIPIISGITGTAIIGGASGYLLLTQNKTTSIEEKFKVAIIDFTKDTNLITTKLEKLKTGTIHSNIQKLKDAQTKANKDIQSGKADLQEACQQIYKSSFDKKESALFKDFKEYCSWNIKDKMGEDWFGSDVNWNTRFGKISQTTTKPSSESLKKVTSHSELQKWCTDIAKEIFAGEEDLELKDAKEYCKKVN